MLLSITAPQDDDRNPQYMEKVFSSILDSIDRRDRLRLAYGCHEDAVGIFCRFADHLGHKQFQDVVDGTLEDPLESLLGVVQPGDRLQPRILIKVRAVGPVRRLWAKGWPVENVVLP